MSTSTSRFAPLRLLGWAFVLTLAEPFGLALFCVTVVFAGLTPIALTIPVLFLALRLVRGFTDAHRLWNTRVMGVPTPRPYRSTDGAWTKRLLTMAKDPATWRDLAWLLLNATVGVAIRSIVLSLFIYPLWSYTLPTFIGQLPHYHDLFGPFTIDDASSALIVGYPLATLSLILGWTLTPILMRAHANLNHWLLAPTETARLAYRVEQLTTTRAQSVDAHATELRRVERDLHDGAQARLVSLGMSLGLAEEVATQDPEAVKKLIAEARTASTLALSELRALVRGIHPPVLADRGLDGAIQALALSSTVPTEIAISLPGRLPAPVESAAYFAVAETLTNAMKHSGATKAWVRLDYERGRLFILVGDDGRGGADLAAGSGLAGIERRLAAFDGSMFLSSPAGGPTVVSMELPCELTNGLPSAVS
ncbi:MAG TPA: sensor domain-containing protein [Mycobacteriales bacterium]|nr:sensor domain-containing protein [Mycobacteriales bacterium]